MSPMSRTLLKMIMGVLAIYFVLAAFPIFQTVIQSLSLGWNPVLARATEAVVLVSSGPTDLSAEPQVAGLTEVPTIIAPTLIEAMIDPTQAEVLVEPTQTAPLVDATETATITEPILTETFAEPTSSPDVIPTDTALPNNQAVQLLPLPGRIETNTNTYLLPVIRSSYDYSYKVQNGTPVSIQNFARAYAGCSYLAVAGQVFDTKGVAIPNLVVTVKGNLNGIPLDLLGLTGLATEYGPAGYEVQLAGSPMASTGVFTIQVFDLNGNALTAPVPFDTSADCNKNLILINFAP